MGTLKQVFQADLEPDALSPTRLVELYDGITEELRRCASVNPADEIDGADERESDLLDCEAKLLDQAARIQLRTDDDMKALMDIWSKASCIQSEDEIRPSDRIAMNIFRHMSDVQFAKA